MDQMETLQSKPARIYRRCLTDHMGLLIRNPFEPTPWQRGWKQHYSVPTKSCVPRRCALSCDPALWGLARKGWFEKHGMHHMGIVPYISQQLWPCPPQPGVQLRRAFPLWEIRFWCSVFPPAGININWEGKYRNCRGFLICLMRGKCTGNKQQGRSCEWMWHIKALTWAFHGFNPLWNSRWGLESRRVCCPRPGQYFFISNEVVSLNQAEIDCSSTEANSQAKSTWAPYSS